MDLRLACLLFLSVLIVQVTLAKRNGNGNKSGEDKQLEKEIAKALQDGISANIIANHFAGVAEDVNGVKLTVAELEAKIKDIEEKPNNNVNGPIDAKVYRLPDFIVKKHDAAVEARDNPQDIDLTQQELPVGVYGNREGEPKADLTANIQKDSSPNPHVDIRGIYSFVRQDIFDNHMEALEKKQTSTRRRRSVENSIDDPPAQKSKDVKASCDEYIDADYAEIYSPNYPNEYEPNSDCSFYINVPQHQQLTIEFTSFNVEFCVDCACDGLYVKDEAYCGTKPPGQNGLVSYVSEGVHRVRFVTDGNTQLSGFFAIVRRQNVEVTPSPHFCDFDTDMCSYVEDVNDHFDWTRHTGATESGDTGPSGDHTTGSGHYLYIEGSGRNEGDEARLGTAIYNTTTGRGCVRFWYHMYGVDMGTLNVYVNDDDTLPSGTIFTLSGNQGNAWHFAEVDFLATSRHAVVFEGVRGTGFRSDLAIDDIEVTNRACHPVVTTEAPTTAHDISTRMPCDPATQFTCNDGTCIPLWWVCDDIVDCSEGEDEDDCGTSTPTPEPLCDISCNGNFTCSSGYISSPNYPNNYPNNADCTYVIHIPDGHYAYLLFQEVEIEVCGVGECVCDALIIDGIRFCGQTFFASVYLLPNNYGVNEILFQSDFSITYKGFYASVEILPGLPAVDLPNYCSFESLNTCGYMQSEEDYFDWTKGSSRTPSANTGPVFDHTFGDLNGNYMFIETSFPRIFGERARILTPIFRAPTDGVACVSFWYHMFGANINTFTVNLVKVFGSQPNDTESTRLWLRQFDQGNQWLHHELEVNIDTYFQIAFDGICGSGYLGDIAIDDVDITIGRCPTSGTVDTPTTVAPTPQDECNRHIYENFTQFNSPNYPNNYDNNLHCNYTFYVPPNQYAAIYFTDIEIESCGNDCGCDALIIEDIRFCGTTKPGVNGTIYFPLDREITMSFVTDFSVTYRGFHAFAVLFNKIGKYVWIMITNATNLSLTTKAGVPLHSIVTSSSLTDVALYNTYVMISNGRCTPDQLLVSELDQLEIARLALVG
ncbi:MAM and LDL-receptor class A domain-containing protein 1-like [Ptychodera flava]|uniref:MAM and LDL-receptor class A domain-containing protein 1-like n=1 Tax=Ptychodera flava TaxID=63121 RepID=UPI00396AA551